MRSCTLFLAASLMPLLYPAALLAQTHDAYRAVDHVLWVVRDVERTMHAWEGLGFSASPEPVREQWIVTDARGRATSVPVRVAAGALHEGRVLWIQPEADGNLLADFLEGHGDGVYALAYLFDAAAHSAEQTRLAELGVPALATLRRPGERGRYTLFATSEPGRIVLALASDPLPPLEPAPGASDYLAFAQYALIADDVEAVDAFWQRVGLPPMDVSEAVIRNHRYRGEPSDAGMLLGFQRSGPVTMEWIEPLDGPSSYHEHIEAHGEGFHHFGVTVPDMDAAIDRFRDLGIETIQSGAWGEEGKPGSGRFAYVETAPFGGVSLELLWNFRP